MNKKNVVYCNACTREINLDSVTNREDALFIKKEWGFFSEKDLQTHEFVLCEQCYDKMIEKFCLNISITEKKEVI